MNTNTFLRIAGGNISGSHPGEWEDRRVRDAPGVLALVHGRARYTLYHRSQDTTDKLQ